MNLIQLLILFLVGNIILRLLWFITDSRSLRQILIWNLKPLVLLQSLIDLLVTIAVIFTAIYYPLPPTPWDNLFLYGGLILFALGNILAIWGKLAMKDSWTPRSEKIARGRAFITSGPFKYSRNPIYLGILLSNLGILISLRSYLIFVWFIQLAIFYKSIFAEEELLEKRFGKRYLVYKARTARFV